jgi:predicted RNA-binding protein with PIN domain
MPNNKILLVDGYNVINRVPELMASLDGGLENARNRLALQISTWSQTHPAFECVIVFDGDPQYASGHDQRPTGIRYIFSRASHGGDDEIIRFVKNYRGRTSDITVVSDDNNVGNNCRAHGASVQPSSYIMTAKLRHTGGRREPSANGRGLGKKAAAEITKELMKKFGS